MQGPAIMLATFVVLYIPLRLVFRVATEAVGLIAVGIGWLFALDSDPVKGVACAGCLLAGAFFGFRIIPALACAGLGLPPSLARDHARFDALARQTSFGTHVTDGPSNESALDRFMHVSTLRIYNRAVFSALTCTLCHLMFMEIAPLFAACIAVLPTSFPVGFLFKRWLARRSAVEIQQ